MSKGMSREELQKAFDDLTSTRPEPYTVRVISGNALPDDFAKRTETTLNQLNRSNYVISNLMAIGEKYVIVAIKDYEVLRSEIGEWEKKCDELEAQLAALGKE